ncbi:unnamed protein product [Amoebophrya sp. A120]|nr:unnamed protein product [Amoebophrya sp. A120]|eukprot:GSA120T00021064001.1
MKTLGRVRQAKWVVCFSVGYELAYKQSHSTVLLDAQEMTDPKVAINNLWKPTEANGIEATTNKLLGDDNVLKYDDLAKFKTASDGEITYQEWEAGGGIFAPKGGAEKNGPPELDEDVFEMLAGKDGVLKREDFESGGAAYNLGDPKNHHQITREVYDQIRWEAEAMDHDGDSDVLSVNDLFPTQDQSDGQAGARTQTMSINEWHGRPSDFYALAGSTEPADQLERDDFKKANIDGIPGVTRDEIFIKSLMEGGFDTNRAIADSANGQETLSWNDFKDAGLVDSGNKVTLKSWTDHGGTPEQFHALAGTEQSENVLTEGGFHKLSTDGGGATGSPNVLDSKELERIFNTNEGDGWAGDAAKESGDHEQLDFHDLQKYVEKHDDDNHPYNANHPHTKVTWREAKRAGMPLNLWNQLRGHNDEITAGDFTRLADNPQLDEHKFPGVDSDHTSLSEWERDRLDNAGWDQKPEPNDPANQLPNHDSPEADLPHQAVPNDNGGGSGGGGGGLITPTNLAIAGVSTGALGFVGYRAFAGGGRERSRARYVESSDSGEDSSQAPVQPQHEPVVSPLYPPSPPVAAPKTETQVEVHVTKGKKKHRSKSKRGKKSRSRNDDNDGYGSELESFLQTKHQEDPSPTTGTAGVFPPGPAEVETLTPRSTHAEGGKEQASLTTSSTTRGSEVELALDDGTSEVGRWRKQVLPPTTSSTSTASATKTMLTKQNEAGSPNLHPDDSDDEIFVREQENQQEHQQQSERWVVDNEDSSMNPKTTPEVFAEQRSANGNERPHSRSTIATPATISVLARGREKPTRGLVEGLNQYDAPFETTARASDDEAPRTDTVETTSGRNSRQASGKPRLSFEQREDRRKAALRGTLRAPAQQRNAEDMTSLPASVVGDVVGNDRNEFKRTSTDEQQENDQVALQGEQAAKPKPLVRDRGFSPNLRGAVAPQPERTVLEDDKNSAVVYDAPGSISSWLLGQSDEHGHADGPSEGTVFFRVGEENGDGPRAGQGEKANRQEHPADHLHKSFRRAATTNTTGRGQETVKMDSALDLLSSTSSLAPSFRSELGWSVVFLFFSVLMVGAMFLFLARQTRRLVPPREGLRLIGQNGRQGAHDQTALPPLQGPEARQPSSAEDVESRSLGERTTAEGTTPGTTMES